MTMESQRRSVPCSMAHRTREVVPKRRKADTSNMLPSPPMTWRRRNCAGLAVGFVARVDDRTVEGRLQAHLVFDEVGTLGHLEARNLALLPAPHAARAADNRACHHERCQASDDRVQVSDAGHLVVLMRAVGRALTVRVVLDEHDGFLAQCRQALHDAPGDHLARSIPPGGRRAPPGFRARSIRGGRGRRTGARRW